MQDLPRVPDVSLGLLRDPYRFIGRQCDRLGVDAFRSTLALRPIVCMRGPAAARIFYEGGRFDRRGALPPTVVHLLQDFGSVQTLAGAEHARRKGQFLDTLSDAEVERMRSIFAEEWDLEEHGWRPGDRVVLHDAALTILTRTACRWAGVPLAADELPLRRRQLAAMIERAGSVGVRHWIARVGRVRAERWAQQLILRSRAGELPAGTPLAAVATWNDAHGAPLAVAVAAVELLNLLRPTVAIARFIAFAGLALATEPSASDHSIAVRAVAQETRRRAPFFALIAGRVRTAFSWRGHRFEVGDHALLDLYGTDLDAGTYPHPHSFDARRFEHGDPGRNALVPQGAGGARTGHRCPGESATITVLGEAIERLRRSAWRPAPDARLSVPAGRVPALPDRGLPMLIGDRDDPAD